jgi:hypothetical protein
LRLYYQASDFEFMIYIKDAPHALDRADPETVRRLRLDDAASRMGRLSAVGPRSVRAHRLACPALDAPAALQK